MKVLYHIGNEVNSNTIVKKGVLHCDNQPMYIENQNKRYFFDNIRNVEAIKINKTGTMIKVKNANDTVFLCVPRFFIDKGTGFIIINYFATKKVGKLLTSSMHLQKG